MERNRLGILPGKLKDGFLAKPFDFVIIALALALVGYSVHFAYLAPSGITRVLIEGAGLRWVFPLEAEETIAVSGPLGETVIRIHGGETWVESSPCGNQICVAAGRLSGHWGFAACLPNNVLLMLQGSDGYGLDGRTW